MPHHRLADGARGDVNDDPLFLEMMADEVMKTWDRYRTGRPLVLSAGNVAPTPGAAAR